MKKKILVGIPVKHHVLLAEDEVQGLRDMGFECRTVVYVRNDQSVSMLNKLLHVVFRAFRIVMALYRFRPSMLYLNSRFEPVGSLRDFISVLIIRSFYWRRLRIAIKTHGSDMTVLSGGSFFYKDIVIPFLARAVNVWFFLSREEKQIIRRYNRKFASRIAITSNIINPSRSVASAQFKEKYQLTADKFTVLYAGRMVREKGIFAIVRSIALLKMKSNYLFVFVGDGPDFEAVQQLAKDLGVSEYMRFVGFLPEEESDHFYANADVLLFPTFFNEGFPMVLFKSVASGLPVITTRIRAAKDHLTDPENVLWVEAESPEGIADALTKLYHNIGLRQAMAANNIIIGQKFTRSRVCGQMSEVLLLA